MNLLYLDESGTANGWNVQDHFVLGGIAVHENYVSRLKNQLDGLQRKFFPEINIPVEFHATDIRKGKNRFKDFSPVERDGILADVYSIIGGSVYPNVILFAAAIHVSAVEDALQARRAILEDICQRFSICLRRKRESGLPSKGLIIIDENREEEYRQLINEFQVSGTKYGYINNIVDIPYFAKSHETRMLQYADFCANAVFRYFEKRETRFIDMILPRFDGRSRDGPRDGLKHIIIGDCDCYACSWRTHFNVSD